MPVGPERERTFDGLREAGQKVWKEANDLMLTHLLQYNVELTAFVSSAEDALNVKQEQVWECVHSILGATSSTPMACLSVMLQVLQCLPHILWNLSFQAGVPSMFAYDLEVHEFQP